VIDPSTPLNEPGSHGVASAAPVELTNVPAGARRQLVAPVDGLYVPAAQSVAEVAPVVSTNEPTGAGWQGSAPVAEKDPGEQSAGGAVVVVVDVVVVGTVVVVVDVVVVGTVVVVVDVVVVGTVVVVVDVVVVGTVVVVVGTVVVVVDVVVVGTVVVVVDVVDVVVVEVGAVTFTFFCTVALSPSASVTVSLTVFCPRVVNVRVGFTSVEVDPSGNCQR
jgi:hypothetical protein